MTAVEVAHGVLPQAADDSDTGRDADRRRDPSLAHALADLLDDARVGRVSTAAPGEQWLILRMDEALHGFADIQEMATDDEPARRACVSGTSTTGVLPSALGAGDGPSPGQPSPRGLSVLFGDMKGKGEVI